MTDGLLRIIDLLCITGLFGSGSVIGLVGFGATPEANWDFIAENKVTGKLSMQHIL